MTDVDRLLSEDGARWRAAQPPAPTADPTRLGRPDRSRWQVLAAAAAVVVVAGGAIGIAAARRPPAPPPDPAAALPTGGTPAPDDTVVRDGDLVRGSGVVVALDGRPVRFCTDSRPQTLDTGTPRTEFPPEYCPVGLTLTGVDLDRLTNRHQLYHDVWGTAEITGVYRDRTVTVTAQGAPTGSPDPTGPAGTGLAAPLPADCRAPAGGWPRGEVQSRPGVARVAQYVDAHPDVLGSLSIGYPDSTPSGAVGTQVLLIGTTGSVAEATSAVRRWYTGSLCVRKVAHSRAQMRAAADVIRTAISTPAAAAEYGVLSGAGEGAVDGDPCTGMDVLVYDAAADRLRQRAGADLVEVTAMVRKLVR